MNKKIVIPLVAVLALGLVVAIGASYFHTTTVDLTVTEARSSADMPFSLSGFSGDTKTKDLVIHNAGSTQLCAELTWVENTNTGVTYTNNLPMKVTLAPEADTTSTVTFTVDALSEEGTMNGVINYQKVSC